jgi:hypothetical protein
MTDLVIFTLACGVAVLLGCLGLAAIVKAWRSGSVERNVEAIIRDARNRAYWRGRRDE